MSHPENRSPQPRQAGGPPTDDPVRVLEGAPELLDRYEALAVSSRNALGAVLRVRHGVTGRHGLLRLAVASSVDPHTIHDQVEATRELTSFGHPNVAPVLDLGVSAIGPYVVHGLGDGGPGSDGSTGSVDLPVGLDRLLAPGGRPETEPMAVDIALELARQMFSAAEALHRFGRGWVLGPAPNDLGVRRVGSTATATLLDLGLVRRWQQRAGVGTTGFVVGRLKHTAPELFEAQNAGGDAQGTPASDLYALGLVVYEMLTGRFPIPGESAASLIAGHLFQAPLAFAVSDPADRVPQPVRDLVMRLLAKHPSGRPGSAGQVVDELAEIRRSSPIAPGAPGLPETPGLPDGGPVPLGGGAESVTVDSLDVVATTRQLSMEELRQALEGPPPDSADATITDDVVSDLFLLDEHGETVTAVASDLARRAEEELAEMPTQIRPTVTGEIPAESPGEDPDSEAPTSATQTVAAPTQAMPVDPTASTGLGDIREITSSKTPEVGSVTMPMDVVVAAKRQAAERSEAKRRAGERPEAREGEAPGASGPSALSSPAGGVFEAPPPGEQVPSVTIPMETVVEAKRRHAAKASSTPPPVPSPAALSVAPPPVPSPPSPPGPPSPHAASPGPSPPSSSSPGPPSPSPSPTSAPRSPSSPSAPPPTPQAEPAWDGPAAPSQPYEDRTLSDLGFGGGDDAAQSIEPGARHRRRRRGSGGRWLGLLAVIGILAVVFTLSYQLSGRRLGTSLFGSGDGQAGVGDGQLTDAASPADGESTAASPGAAAGDGSPSAETTDAGTRDAAPPEATPPGATPAPAPAEDLPPGILKLDAAPWASIEAILDPYGDPVPFSGARSTPKLVELAPGRYQVVLRRGDERETLSVEIPSQQVVELRAPFTMSVEEFMNAADW